MPHAVLEDPAIFSDLDAAEALAAKLNEDLPAEKGTLQAEPAYGNRNAVGFTVVAGNRHHDLFYVVDQQGRRVTETGKPPRLVNPMPGIPDRKVEPPTKHVAGNAIKMSEPDERGISHYLGTHRHG